MKLIDAIVLRADRFGVEEGYQPTDAFFYVTEGSFSLTVDGRTEIIHENELVFFPRDMRFSRKILSPLSFYYVKLLPAGISLPRGRVLVADRARLLSTLRALSVLSADEAAAREHYLNDVFVQLYTERVLFSLPSDSIASRAVAYFEAHLAEKISLDAVAEAVGASVSSLISHFKAAYGQTPMRYLTLLRLKRAEALLLSRGTTLEGIARASGYDNAFYFSNAFKKEKGISPSAYRRKFGV